VIDLRIAVPGATSGDDIAIRLLRPNAWLSHYHVARGGYVDLDFGDVVRGGRAVVTGVEEAPALTEGTRCPVTGLIASVSRELITITLEDSDRPIEATTSHTFYSADRSEWTEAGSLRPGESVSTKAGAVRVLDIVSAAQAPTPVFNLEVYGEHQFYVHDDCVLTHNACGKPLKTWLKKHPDLLKEVRQWYKNRPKWWGINPERDRVFYRAEEEVKAIRGGAGESGGHHPWGLALGGPKGQKLTQTGETMTQKNKVHSTVTGLQRRVINVIKKQGNK
jgi:hypothetical protein